MDMSTLRERIRELRGDSTQEEAAHRCGMSQPSWSKLERGNGETGLLGDIADAFGCNYKWLKTGKGLKYPNPQAQFIVAQALDARSRLQALLRSGDLDDHDLILLANVAFWLSARRKLPEIR